MLDGKHPRVTIVSSNPLRGDTCNGMLMRSLFKGWPKEQVAQVYFRVSVPHLPNGDDCHDYRVIGMTGSVRCVDGSNDGSARGTSEPAAGNSKKTSRRQRLGRGLKQRPYLFGWMRSTQEILGTQPWILRALEHQLQDLRPDIVYALLTNYSLTKLITIACQRLGIPLFVHVVDDFVTALYRDRPLASKLQADSQRWFGRVVAAADGLAAVSPIMAEEYGRRYQKKWTWFTTLADADTYDPSPRSPDGTIRLVYAGSLGLARWKSLRALALALKKLRDERGIESRLLIYSSPEHLDEHRQALEIPPVTELRGWVPPEKLPQVFEQADVLVHAESFQPSFVDFTKLSFSTKLSQYMMAGRCILAIGPENLGSIRVLRDAGAAVSISETDSEVILASLHKLLSDPASRQRLAQNGRDWAMRNVEIQSGQDRFRQQIVDALVRSRSRKRHMPAT